ncbi:MAG TPA: PAS domain S-box protein, partial [Blastocatellia bacterium]|nr:PAS domain S-box protein [Blastocatellia bacterium]
IDGVEAAEQIRRRYNIPVVYLTAYADGNTLQRAKITEPYAYLLKPFEDRQLHITIEMALYKHRMEKKIKESERWLAAVLRSIDDGVIATDLQGLITYMNTVAEVQTGWRQQEAVGKDLTEVFTLRNGKVVVAESPALRAMREGTIIGQSRTVTLVSREGSEIPIDYTASPIKDEKGNILGAVIVFRDVTERRHAEELLMQSAERYRALVETSSDIVFTLSRDGKVISLNPAFETLTGWTRKEWMGRPFADIIHPPDLPLAMEFLQRVLHEATPLGCEFRIISRSGEPVAMEFMATPHFREGKVSGIWGIGRHATAVRRVEEPVRR